VWGGWTDGRKRYGRLFCILTRTSQRSSLSPSLGDDDRYRRRTLVGKPTAAASLCTFGKRGPLCSDDDGDTNDSTVDRPFRCNNHILPPWHKYQHNTSSSFAVRFFNHHHHHKTSVLDKDRQRSNMATNNNKQRKQQTRTLSLVTPRLLSALTIYTTILSLSMGRSHGFCIDHHQHRRHVGSFVSPRFFFIRDQHLDRWMEPLRSMTGDADQEEEEENTDQPTVAERLLEQLSPMKSCRPDQMGGTDLAYIGDVVFELFIRSRCVWPSKRTSDLQNQVVALVRGESNEHFIFW
jgi:hypothetical protein